MENILFSENNLPSSSGLSIKKFSEFQVASDDDTPERERDAPVQRAPSLGNHDSEDESDDDDHVDNNEEEEEEEEEVDHRGVRGNNNVNATVNNHRSGDGDDTDDNDNHNFPTSLQDTSVKREKMVPHETSVFADHETTTAETVEIPDPMHWNPKKKSRQLSSLTAIYDRSQKQAAAAEERIKKLRSALEESKFAEYTFKPQISEKAHKMQNSSSHIIESVEENRERLRQRLLDMSEIEEYSFCPQICRKSSLIVEKSRAKNENETSVVNRLYHSTVHPEILEDHKPKKVRTQKEIDKHISSLYEFEEQRKNLLANLRQKLYEKEPRSHSVNTNELVARLYTKKLPVDPTTVYKETENNLSERCSPQNEKYLKSAKIRGLQKWFFHFSSMSDVLSLTDLDNYQGLYLDEKIKVQQLLQRHSNQNVWKVEEFIEILSTHEDPSWQLWKIHIRSPPDNGAETRSFKPKIDPVSSLLIERKSEGRLPAHDRLFFAARDLQLKKSLKMLEEEKQQLSEQAQRQAKQHKLRAMWRRISEKELLEHKNIKDVENIRYIECKSSPQGLENSEGFTSEKNNADRAPSSVVLSLEDRPPAAPSPPCVVQETEDPVEDFKITSPSPSLDHVIETAMSDPTTVSTPELITTDHQTNDAIEQLLKIMSEKAQSAESMPCQRPPPSFPMVNPVLDLAKPMLSDAHTNDSGAGKKMPDTSLWQKETRDALARKNYDKTEINDFLLRCSLCSGVQPISCSQPSLESKRKLQNLGKTLYRQSRGI